MPTQRYDVPYGRIRNQYVGIISVDLNRIQNCHRNMERVAFFHTVVLQHVRLVSGSINIHERIDSFFNMWNNDAYDELVQYSYRSA